MSFKVNNPGCACDCTSCGQICVTDQGCSFAALVGSTITVKLGSTVIGTCTTNSLGKCCVPITTAGTYTVTSVPTGTTYAPKTATVAATCITNNVTINHCCGSVCGTVYGCGVAYPGATVTLSNGLTAVTDASGNYCIPISAAGSYTATVTHLSGDHYIDTAASASMTCSANTLNIFMDVAAGYQCSPNTCCAILPGPPYPTVTWPTTIYIDDGFGVITLTGTFPGWDGCATRPATGVLSTSCPLTYPPPEPTGAMTVGMYVNVYCDLGSWHVLFSIKSNCSAYNDHASAHNWLTPGDCSSAIIGRVDTQITIPLTLSACPASFSLSGSISLACDGTNEAPIANVYTCGTTFPVSVSQ